MFCGHSIALSIPFVSMLGRVVLITARACDVQALIGKSCACRWSSTLRRSYRKITACLLQLMKHPRPHAHVPCRYRRPQHGELWFCCWSPLLGATRENPNMLQRRCRGNSCQMPAPRVAWAICVALKLQHTVMPLDMTQSLMTAGTRSSRAMTSDGSATRATQLARGMVAAAQLCFRSAESRAWVRSWVVSLSEDIDANVIHKRARGDYDPLKHAGFVDNRGERPHVDEPWRASLVQAFMRKKEVQSQGSIATTVDWVPQSSVRLWVHEDMRVLHSAWWRFCRDVHGGYMLKEES